MKIAKKEAVKKPQSKRVSRQAKKRLIACPGEARQFDSGDVRHNNRKMKASGGCTPRAEGRASEQSGALLFFEA
jgi:hypothetical protein